LLLERLLAGLVCAMRLEKSDCLHDLRRPVLVGPCEIVCSLCGADITELIGMLWEVDREIIQRRKEYAE
jgi:hypothetical protein